MGTLKVQDSNNTHTSYRLCLSWHHVTGLRKSRTWCILKLEPCWVPLPAADLHALFGAGGNWELTAGPPACWVGEIVTEAVVSGGVLLWGGWAGEVLDVSCTATGATDISSLGGQSSMLVASRRCLNSERAPSASLAASFVTRSQARHSLEPCISTVRVNVHNPSSALLLVCLWPEAAASLPKLVLRTVTCKGSNSRGRTPQR